MNMSTISKTVLIVSGLLGAGIGLAILLAPVAFHGTSGIRLGDDVSLLNEIRASGGALFAGGVLILIGAFFAGLAFTSLVVASVLYLSYGLSRILSIAVDGVPDAILVQATVLEILIGLACVFALVRFPRAKARGIPVRKP